jgi:hypothetical protein
MLLLYYKSHWRRLIKKYSRQCNELNFDPTWDIKKNSLLCSELKENEKIFCCCCFAAALLMLLLCCCCFDAAATALLLLLC